MSQHVVAYYETDGSQPPGALLVDLAQALRVTTDELLGVEPLKERVSPKAARLRKRLSGPAADQRAVLKFVNALAESRGINDR